MSLKIADRVRETTTTTGTGALTLAGAATGFRAFSSVCSVNDTCYYAIQAVDASGVPTGDWEVGLGTYSATNTLTRTVVLASSNSNAAVSLASGTKQVWLDLVAAQVAAQLKLQNTSAANAWDPAFATATLSNSNLTATCPGGSYKGSVATPGLTQKSYFEVTITGSIATTNAAAGVAPQATIASQVGFSIANSAGLQFTSTSGGTKVFYNAGTAGAVWSGVAFAVGNVIGVAYDPSTRKVWFNINGGNWNNDVIGNQNPATGTGGYVIGGAAVLYPAFNSDVATVALINCGAAAFAYSTPSGFVGPDTSLPLVESPADVAITSPSDGQILVYSGSASKWQNVANAVDVLYAATANKPTTTGFTLTQNTNLAGNGSMTNLTSGRGFVIRAPCTSSADNALTVGKSVPAGSPWSIITLLGYNIAWDNASSFGLFVADAAGKITWFGVETFSTQNFRNVNWTNLNTFFGRTSGPTRVATGNGFIWMKLTYTGSVFNAYVSQDGETWVLAFTVSSTAFISTPSTCGIWVNANNAAAGTTTDSVVTVYHYQQG